MFDIKLYDETGERETIRGLSWSQMTTVQSVIARLHFLLGNKQYKHKSNQVADESEIAALRSQLATVTAEREAYKRIIDDVRAGNYDNANDSLAARKFIYKELEALKGGKG